MVFTFKNRLLHGDNKAVFCNSVTELPILPFNFLPKGGFLSWQKSLAYQLRKFADNFSLLLTLQRVLAAWFKIFS